MTDKKNGKADSNAERIGDGAGFKGPYVLLHGVDNVTEEEFAQGDRCIEDILAGSARFHKDRFPVTVESETGWHFLPDDLFQYFLERLDQSGFDCDLAVMLCNILIKSTRWNNLDYKVDRFLDHAFRDRWFDVDSTSDRFGHRHECKLKPGLTAADCDEQLLRFVCHVAICHKVYGPSYATISTNYYLDMVSQIRPDMVNSLKKHGTGNLPAELASVSNDLFKAKANDAFGTLKITALADTAACYERILHWLCSVIVHEDFPHSYAIEFKGPTKIWLPIRGLPRKGINQLFACAARFTELHPLLEIYACLAMREDEFYTCLSDEDCALPGSFAVFALGMADTRWIPLVCDYLKMCDDEHSSLQVKFVRDMLLKWGINSQTVEVLVYAVLSTQSLTGFKALAEPAACRESLEALLEARTHLSDWLTHLDYDDDDPFDDEYDCDDDDDANAMHSSSPDRGLEDRLWEDIKFAIWGRKALTSPQTICSNAPEQLRSLYADLLL